MKVKRLPIFPLSMRIFKNTNIYNIYNNNNKGRKNVVAF